MFISFKTSSLKRTENHIITVQNYKNSDWFVKVHFRRQYVQKVITRSEEDKIRIYYYDDYCDISCFIQVCFHMKMHKYSEDQSQSKAVICNFLLHF